MSLLISGQLDIATLGHHLLSVWKELIGAARYARGCSFGPDAVAVLMEDAFAPAEQALAKREGVNRLSPAISGSCLKMYVQRACFIEQVAGSRVKTLGATLDIHEGWATCIYTFERQNTRVVL